MSSTTARASSGPGRTVGVRPVGTRRTPRSTPTRLIAPALAAAGVLLLAGPAMAANTGGDPMPWEGPMEQFLNFFTGPFVRIAAVLAIVLLGVGMAFSENGTGMRKLVTAFFGISLAFGAATWGLQFFGFTGGATIGVPTGEVEVERARLDAGSVAGDQAVAGEVVADAGVRQ